MTAKLGPTNTCQQLFARFFHEISFPPTVRTRHLYFSDDEFEETWRDESGSVVADKTLLSYFVAARHGDTKQRNEVFFNYGGFGGSGFSIICRLECSRLPNASTQDKLFEIIDKTRSRAEEHYQATHDSGTDLLNRAALEGRLSKAIRDYRSSAPTPDTGATVTPNPQNIAVITFDIDHFKQINDTYGHMYGDVVLRALAHRVTGKVNELTNDGSISINVGRTGGEEFTLICIGRLEHDQSEVIAEQIRTIVSLQSLPSDDEWARFGQGSHTLPPLKERNITISVGWSHIHGLETIRSDFTFIKSELLERADKALYRSKKGGRNCTTSFGDILARCGRVLEHHSDMGVVAIDIGANVGVLRGQQFDVYHPDFDGKKPFILSDGRTTRQLGMYPRLPLARITVFNSQEEISFCEIDRPTNAGGAIIPIPHESRLEALPMGSIRHLLRHTDPGLPGDSLLSGEQLQERVVRAATSGQVIVVAVLRIINIDEVRQQRGSVAVNNAMLTIYDYLCEVQKNGTTDAIGQPELDQIAVIWTAESDPDSHLTALRKRLTSDVLINAGIFTTAPGLEPTEALRGAQYASLCTATESQGVIRFGEAVANSIMDLRRREKAGARSLLVDYMSLKRIGDWGGNFYHLAALAMFEAVWARSRSLEPGDIRDAILEAGRLAVEKLPKSEVSRANLALFCAVAGLHEVCLDLFLEAISINPTVDLMPIYISRLLASVRHQLSAGRIDTNTARALLEWVQTRPIDSTQLAYASHYLTELTERNDLLNVSKNR